MIMDLLLNNLSENVKKFSEHLASIRIPVYFRYK